MTNRTSIEYFVKTVDHRCHAEQLMQGDLYMNRLHRFIQDEDETEGENQGHAIAGREDSKEGLVIYRGEDLSNLTVTLGIAGEEMHDVDGMLELSIGFNLMRYAHVFCLFSGKRPSVVTTENVNTVEENLLFPYEKMEKEIGPYSVFIYNPRVFVERVREALRKCAYRSFLGLVQYYPNTESVNMGYHPLDGNIEPAFRKEDRFAYQKEFRIAIVTGSMGDDHLVINIGSISDIARMVKTSDLATLRYEFQRP